MQANISESKPDSTNSLGIWYALSHIASASRVIWVMRSANASRKGLEREGQSKVESDLENHHVFLATL
jgi:hypothetical protein